MNDIPHRRTIRSFVRREGRMTAGQKKAFETYWPRYGLDATQALPVIHAPFGHPAPVVLEIGFGTGDSLAQQALARISHQQSTAAVDASDLAGRSPSSQLDVVSTTPAPSFGPSTPPDRCLDALATIAGEKCGLAQPQCHYIGIEVHRPGVGHLLSLIAKHQLDNVRIYCADAVEVLTHCIPDNSLDTVQIFFPDPWHKKRHHKRRLVQTPMVSLIASKLKPGGSLHTATDWENYAEHMLQVLSACPELANTATNGQFVERPASRPLTKFETRGQRLGHGVWDLVFGKKPL